MRFIAPTWEEIYTQSILLAGKIRDNTETPDCIIGISRGGLVLARIMSDLLDIQTVYIVKCEYYSDVGKTNRKPRITQGIPGDIERKRILIVDDVADTGESLIEIKKYLSSKKPKSLKVATLYIKPWSKILPDFNVGRTSSWIVFPWELHETIKLLSSKKLNVDLAKAHIPAKFAKMIYKMDGKLSRI